MHQCSKAKWLIIMLPHAIIMALPSAAYNCSSLIISQHLHLANPQHKCVVTPAKRSESIPRDAHVEIVSSSCPTMANTAYQSILLSWVPKPLNTPSWQPHDFAVDSTFWACHKLTMTCSQFVPDSPEACSFASSSLLTCAHLFGSTFTWPLVSHERAARGGEISM